MIRPGTKIDILGDIMAGPLKLSARVWALICHWDGACIARKNEITARFLYAYLCPVVLR